MYITEWTFLSEWSFTRVWLWPTCGLCVPHFRLVSLLQGIIRAGVYTLSGRTGCELACHTQRTHVWASVAEARLEICSLHLHRAIRGDQGVLPMIVWGCDQSIGSTGSDTIVHSWLWLTATRSSPLGCFSTLLQVVYNWTHILW